MIEYFKQGCKKAMDYWAEYLGIPDLIKNNDIVLPAGFKPKKITKFFQPCTTITKTITHFSPPKRRDPSRRWK